MASIPFPELNVPQYQAPDLLGMAGKYAQLRQALQAQQFQQQMQPLQLQQQAAQTAITQQDLKDMQLSTQALQNSNGDPANYLEQLRKGGVSWKAYSTVQNGLLDYQTKQANLSKLQADNQQTAFDKVESQLTGARQNFQSNPQLAQSFWDQAMTTAEQGNLVAPGQLNHTLPASLDGVTDMENRLGFHSKIAENALKLAQTNEAVSKGNISNAEWQGYQNWMRVPGNEFKSWDDYKSSQAVSEDVAKTKAIQPYKLQQVQAEAAVHAAYQNLQMLSRDAYSAVDSGVVKPYNATMDKVAALKDSILLAKQTNNPFAAATAFAQLAGIETPAGAGRLTSKVYDQKYGNLPTQISGVFKQLATGNKMTDDLANQALTFADQMGTTATNSANRNIDEISRIHRVPITRLPDYKPTTTPTPPVGAGGVRVGQQVTLKNGKTVTITAVHPDGTFDAK